MRIVWSAAALSDLDRFAQFLQQHHPELAGRIAQEIVGKISILAEYPGLGRPIGSRDGYRQLVMKVLGGHYVFQYRLRVEEIAILRVFHGREARWYEQ